MPRDAVISSAAALLRDNLCAQVNACIDKYLYTQRASRLAARLQREGKEVPRTFEGMSKLMGASLRLLCIGAMADTLQAHRAGAQRA